MSSHYPFHELNGDLPRITVDERPIEEITLETKQSVLNRVIDANARLPKFRAEEIEMFINGIPTYKV